MRALGIRASSDRVTFAVFEPQEAHIVNTEAVLLPRALELPERLKYLRTTVLDLLREYDVTRAGLRTTEPSATRPNLSRIQHEAVIQEAFASSALEGYFCGPLATVSGLLGMDRKAWKPYVSGTIDYPDVENWQLLSPDEREAVLTAIGAVND